MKVAGVNATSLADGKGINYVLFAQGCDIHCKECQNPSTWATDGGVEMSVEEIEGKIESYVPPVSGVTFSGGESSMQMDEVKEIAAWAKSKGLQTTIYTGHTIDELFKKRKLNIFSPFDYVIDGAFDCKQKERLPFRGSRNQKIWKHLPDGSYKTVDFDDSGNEIDEDVVKIR